MHALLACKLEHALASICCAPDKMGDQAARYLVIPGWATAARENKKGNIA